MAAEWQVTSVRGSAGEFHRREPEDDTDAVRELWWFEVDRPAIVLGSAQPEHTVDAVRCVREGIEIVRRRSGGGSVLMYPGEILWVDVILPADDPLADADVGRSMWWIGEVWAEALEDLGVVGTAIHRGPLVATAWSQLVCFDGVGAGEVLVDGRKAVGVSQRRTRHWSRIQTAMHLRWRAELVGDLVRPSAPDDGGPQAPWVLPAGSDPAVVRQAFLRALAQR